MSIVTEGSEQRIVLREVSWETFLALSKEACGGRLAYDRGQLEIMSPSYEHENIKGIIARLVEVYTEELGIDMSSAGSTTLSRKDLARGLESDECFYIAAAPRVRGQTGIDLPADPPPDLAIEVDISKSSLDKLAIYADLGIPEVWRYDGDTIEIRVLREDRRYATSDASRVLPRFPLGELNRILSERGSQSETQIARGFRQWIRENLLA